MQPFWTDVFINLFFLINRLDRLPDWTDMFIKLFFFPCERVSCVFLYQLIKGQPLSLNGFFFDLASQVFRVVHVTNTIIYNNFFPNPQAQV